MRRRRTRRRRNEHAAAAEGKTHFSFSFLLAIPGNFFVASIACIALVGLVDNNLAERDVWIVYATGLLGALVIIGTTKAPRLRTFVHELKHAMVVVLTGNRIHDFHVDTHSGHVAFSMYRDRLHFAPMITLAPYFFPLFSLPALILCIALEPMHKVLLAMLLGFTLGADISLSVTELHPHQTDLKKVTGGFIGGALYLAGFHFMWTMMTLVWVFGGRSGFAYLAAVTWAFIERFARQIEPYFM